MNKHLTTGRVVRYLACLVLAFAVVLGATYARYVQEVQGQGTGTVAAVALGLEGSADLTSELQGMKPGDKREVKFAVTNAESGTKSEVAQTYDVSVETTGNLPLTFALTPNDDAGGEGSFAAGGSDLTWTGGVLPFGNDVSHSYTLTVTWLADRTEPALADEIDRVVLKIDAQQAAPKGAS